MQCICATIPNQDDTEISRQGESVQDATEGKNMNQLQNLEPVIRLSIKNPESESGSLFGRGIADLCLGVRTTGSLNAAAKSMGMAYSKAWRIMKETEAALDIQLLHRDGAHGSTLTEEGDKLLDTYLEIDKKMHAEAIKVYQKLLAKN